MIVNIKYKARMIGDYNDSRLYLMADKMCGSNAATLAFINDKQYGYCSSSAIKGDIRDLVSQYHPIHAIYQKQLNEDKYRKQCYTSKKLMIQLLPDSIKQLIKQED